MNRISLIIASVVILLAVAMAGYHLGNRNPNGPEPLTSNAKPQASERKILYYRNPMGLPDTSPVPKKDSMGMDYVPVYDGEAGGEEGVVNLSVAKVQKLGVKSVAATRQILSRTLHATGRIEVDENRTYTIAPKFEGWVEQLHVSRIGETVTRGQPLFEVYSPELISAQREYAIAKQGVATLKNADEEAKASMQQLADASLSRLKNWDISTKEISNTGTSKRNLTYYSPVSGIVLEKKAVQGMRFMPGEVLYQIADLSTIWVLADVPEQDIGTIQPGSKAMLTLEAYPGQHFEGDVSFIYPTLNTTTRTVQVRVEMTNSKGLFKPGMFADVTLPVGKSEAVLAVPNSAVIDSGTRQIVLVQKAEGHFAPRKVRLGNRNADYVEVLEGITEGEKVVTSALFLIDAESNLKAALGGMDKSSNDQLQQATAPAKTDSFNADPFKGKTTGHQAHGILNEVYDDGSVSITHEPVKELGWPAMTMDFDLANSSLAEGIKPGSAVNFEIVEREPGEWVITRLNFAAHKGH